MVIVEHDMSVVFGLANRISVLVYGEIIATDTPARIRDNAAVQAAYLGSAARCLKSTIVHAYYGKSHILQGVTFRVGEGEIVSLLGRNGAGRSTAVKTIMGSCRRSAHPPSGARASTACRRTRSRAGAGLRSGGPRDLSVADRARESAARHEEPSRARRGGRSTTCYALFPMLRERQDAPGGVLSGGEQQMLTICRTLMGDPALIMIDEPTEGLAPQVVARVRGLLERIAERGVAILLIEQKLTIALAISHRLYVMGQGRIVFEGSARDLRDNDAIRREWLEV